MRMIKNIILTITVVALTLSIISTVLVTNSYVYAKSAYQSGYDHGVHDAHTPSNQWYILQPGKGFNFHTREFNEGYIAGYCADKPSGVGSDADQATFSCP
jgi:hypothetical protein